MNLFSRSRIDTDVLLRGFAISWVVFNHAGAIPNRPIELGGGLNLLLILSGLAFARFTLTGDDAGHMRRSIVRFTTNLLIPCLAFILLSFCAYREFSWPELLFYRNWIDLDHISPMYTWYPSVIAQIMLLLLTLTYVPSLPRLFAARPVTASVCAMMLSLVILVLGQSIWSGDYAQRLPHFVLWNFVLGWVIYFFVKSGPAVGPLPRMLLVVGAGIVGVCSFWTDEGWLRILSLVCGTAVLLTVKRVPVPLLVGRTFTILSQATFAIFIFHVPFLRAFDALGLRQYQEGLYLPDILMAWTITMVGSIGIWIVLTSLVRAMRFCLSQPIAEMGDAGKV